MSTVGLIGLAVMGQNLALNVAEKGFPISVYNRSGDKTDACVSRAAKEGENLSSVRLGIDGFSSFLELHGGAALELRANLVFTLRSSTTSSMIHLSYRKGGCRQELSLSAASDQGKETIAAALRRSRVPPSRE